MLGKGDGLRPLQVGIARHNRLLMGRSLLQQHLDQIQHHGLDLSDLPPQIQPQIHRHLVVAASGRMEPFAGIPDALGQERLDIHVNVFVIGRELHLPGFDIRQQVLQALGDGRGIRLGDDAGIPQHFRMGQRPLDVLAVHPLVKADGGIEIIDKGVGLLLEPSGPELHICHLVRIVFRLSWASAFAACRTTLSLRTSPQTGVAIRIPLQILCPGERIAASLRSSQ